MERRTIKILLILSLCIGIIYCFGNQEATANELEDLSPVEQDAERLYSQMLSDWEQKGIADVQDVHLVIDAAEYESASEAVQLVSRYEGKSNVVMLPERGWVDYTVEIPREGLYQLQLEYIPVNETNIPIQLSLQIDGIFPFYEARNIELERIWKDEQFPPPTDHKDNQIRPLQVGILEWLERPLRDSTYSHDQPLKWHFTQGRHTIRINTLFEELAVSQVSLTSPTQIPTYEKAMQTYPQTEGPASDWYTVIEAEQMNRKSEPSVQMQASRDDLAIPKSDGKIVFNTMGGDRWTRGGQRAEWVVEVPEDGLYHIHLKFFQGYYREISTFREIEINGEVPFQEMKAYPFPFHRNWQDTPLQSRTGEIYSFYLKKGTNTIAMTVTQAPLTPVLESMQNIVNDVQFINRTIRLVTGVRDSDHVDKNRDWNLEANIPNLKERLLYMKSDLEEKLRYLQEIYGNEVNTASAIRSAIDELEKLADDPNVLPYQPEKLSAIQESLSAYMTQLSLQPLMLDQIYVTSPAASLPQISPDRWDIVKNTVKTFFLTFSDDYFDYGRQDEDAAITVWINRGRDYVQLLQQMTDELFTPQTGYKVNVNIMPNPHLLILSNAAGREPDIALGLDQLMPVDFAMRNALVDLSQLDGYEEVASQFHPGAMIPFHYDNGEYALPETKMFNVIFYRMDILEELGIDIPQTWSDVYDILPTLQQNGYDFFIQPEFYLPFFYQNGVEFYSSDGLKTGLDRPEAFDSFKQWTDLYTIYGLPREVPSFYMHFRNGNIPIGISDYNTYLQLLVAAPELAGSWGVAPMPGMENEQGEIERWNGGMLQAGVIFKSTENVDASWEFLKWWTSTETQARYGNDLEMFHGIEFRWNTANLNAFQQLPFPREHAEQIMAQYKWFKEIPIVPGGYFTQRELVFGWNRTVLSDINFRESLEESIFEINRELLRKQEEFGLVDQEGNIIRNLHIPVVNEPWEGGTDNE